VKLAQLSLMTPQCDIRQVHCNLQRAHRNLAPFVSESDPDLVECTALLLRFQPTYSK
jgi:hypothetical protein